MEGERRKQQLIDDGNAEIEEMKARDSLKTPQESDWFLTATQEQAVKERQMNETRNLGFLIFGLVFGIIILVQFRYIMHFKKELETLQKLKKEQTENVTLKVTGSNEGAVLNSSPVSEGPTRQKTD